MALFSDESGNLMLVLEEPLILLFRKRIKKDLKCLRSESTFYTKGTTMTIRSIHLAVV